VTNETNHFFAFSFFLLPVRSELVNKILETGNFEKTFNASTLASGVYIYRITAMKDGKILFNESKQMLLIK
jgi:hypothetical protein